MAKQKQSKPVSKKSKVTTIPPKLLAQIANTLKSIGYADTLKSLKSEGSAHGILIDESSASGPGLLDMWVQQAQAESKDAIKSEDSDSSSDSDSEDDVAQRGGVPVAVKSAGTSEDTSDDTSDEEGNSESRGASKKRKRSSDSSSGSETSSSGSSSDSSQDGPSTKRTRYDSDSDDSDSSSASSDTSSSDTDSDSDGSSSSGSSSSGSIKSTKSSSSSNSGSSSTSGSGSSSDSDSSSSESDSESDSDSADAKKAKHTAPISKGKLKNKATTKSKPAKLHVDSASASSATVAAESPDAPEVDDTVVGNGNIHPDRAKRMPNGVASDQKPRANGDKIKASNSPFQRVASNTVVDPRFSSNAYVSYDYADRAHRDLIVTKGKGFTKEKNKKKRGSYRGGMIDLTPKGIKFDD